MTVFALAANGASCDYPSDCDSGNCVGVGYAGESGTCQASGGLGGGGAGGLPGGGNTGTTLINPLSGSGNLNSFLEGIRNFVIRIGTVVVVLMIVFVGFKFVTARGEPGEITKARTMLLWTIVGALILLGAQAIRISITATINAISTGS